MGAIITGTVLYWEVVNPGTQNERVKHKDDRVVSVYLTDDGEDANRSALVSKYTLDEIAKVAALPASGNSDTNQLAKAKDLLKAAQQGLLRADGVTRETVMSPSAP
jgi:hypothetical protein